MHINGIELAVRPDHAGGVVFKSVFSAQDAKAVSEGSRQAEEALDTPEFRRAVHGAAGRAMRL